MPWLVAGLESESWCLFWLYVFLDNVALAVSVGFSLSSVCYVSACQVLNFCFFAERALLTFIMRWLQEEEPPGMQQDHSCSEQYFVLLG